jgi:hypothetical protein
MHKQRADVQVKIGEKEQRMLQQIKSYSTQVSFPSRQLGFFAPLKMFSGSESAEDETDFFSPPLLDTRRETLAWNHTKRMFLIYSTFWAWLIA